MTVGFTQLQIYKRCSRRAWYSYLGYRPKTTPTAMDAGKQFHAAISAYYNKTTPSFVPNDAGALAAGYFTRYVRKYSLDPDFKEILGTEVHLEYQGAHGDIDLVALHKEGDLCLADHKTGNPDPKLWLIQGQLDYYAALYFKCRNEAPALVCYSIITPKEAYRIFKTPNYDWGAVLLDEARGLEARGVEGSEPPNPQYDCSQNCRFFDVCALHIEHGARAALECLEKNFATEEVT